MGKIDGRIQLWSSGGGVQSTAIAVLIIQGKLPKPHLAGIADTGRERTYTFEYYDKYVYPAMMDVGVKLHRIDKALYATVDLYRNDDILIPAYTNQNGKMGKLPTFCSNEWKQRVIRRWASETYENADFDVWLGMSVDEPRRIKQVDGRWQNKYPLFALGLTRQDCVDLVKAFVLAGPTQIVMLDVPQPHAGRMEVHAEERTSGFSACHGLRARDPG